MLRAGLIVAAVIAGAAGIAAAWILSADRSSESESEPRTSPASVERPERAPTPEHGSRDTDGAIHYARLAEQAAQRWNLDEIKAYAKDMEARYDLDGDGKLSDDERRQMWAQMRADYEAEMLAQFDADGDGELNDEEQRAARISAFLASDWGRAMARKHDANNDGILDKAELAALEAELERMRQEWTEPYDLDGDEDLDDLETEIMRESWKEQWEGVQARVNERFDADGSGKLEPGEQMRAWAAIQAAYRQRAFVQTHDTNGDRVVDAQDLAEFTRRFADQDPLADLNRDGVWNTADLDEFNRRLANGENTMPDEEDLPLPEDWADKMMEAQQGGGG
ncbi:MAG: dockerin type I domain-containing protein [Phycisphaerales bacterium JB040]